MISRLLMTSRVPFDLPRGHPPQVLSRRLSLPLFTMPSRAAKIIVLIMTDSSDTSVPARTRTAASGPARPQINEPSHPQRSKDLRLGLS